MNTVSVTVDITDYNALTRASDMLHGLAVDIKNTAAPSIDPDKEKRAAEVLKENGIIPKADVIAAVTTPPPPANTGDTPPPPPPAAEVVTPTGVELDSAGLPWDVRIHGKKKAKTKKEGTWKLTRGVDKALVDKVEAELKAAMAVPAGSTVENSNTGPSAAEAFAASAENPLVQSMGAGNTPLPPTATPEIDFPALMVRLTPALADGSVTNDAVLKAVNDVGLAALPILAARPDLVPAVYIKLFPA